MADRSIRVILQAEVAGYKAAIADAAKATERAAATIDRDGKKIDTAAGRMVRSAEVNRDAWDKAGTSITGFGVAGVAALALSTKAAVDWETAWAGVLKTTDGTAAQYSALEASLRSMASVKPAPIEEIARVAETAGQLGVAIDDIAAFTSVMIDLGETTNLSADEAATAIARMANIMGTSVADVARMGSTIVALGNNAATTESEITDLATRLAAAGRLAGLSESDTLAFASALTSVGVEAEAGGTALSKVFTRISDAARDGGADLETFANVAGMSVEQFKTLFEQDAAQAIGAFVEGMGRLSSEGRSTTAVFESLELTDERLKRSILSLGSATGLLGDQLALANQAWDDNTALASEAEKRYDTAAAKVQIAKNAINEAAIVVGDNLLPALAFLAQSVAAVSESFAGLPTFVTSSITGLATLASVVAVLGGGFLLVVPRVIETVKALETIGVISPRVAAGLGRVTTKALSLAKGIGVATAAVVAFDAIADTLTDFTVHTAGIGEVTKALLDMADGADVATTALGAMLSYGVGDSLRTGGQQIESLADAFDRLAQSQSGFAGVQTWIGDHTGFIGDLTQGDLAQSREAIEGIDQALAGLVQSGATSDASRIMRALADETGYTVTELKAFLPAYRDALATTSTETEESTAATDAYNAELEAQAAALKDSQGALKDYRDAVADAEQAWRDGIAGADAEFISLVTAYDDVIAKNQEWAQSVADSTEDAEDSWQTYYNGVDVSVDDFIAKLQEQVDAQTKWEENTRALAERLAGVAGGEELINSLLNQGPQGANTAALLAGMTDAELQQVVDLYAQTGAEATSAFVAEIEAITGPSIPTDLDMAPAETKLAQFQEQMDANPLLIPVSFGLIEGGPAFLSDSAPSGLSGSLAGGGALTTPGGLRAYEDGGLAEAGWALVGEKGPEIVNFTDPARVYTADETAATIRALARAGKNDSADSYRTAPAPEVHMIPVHHTTTNNAPITINTSAPTIRDAEAERRRRLLKMAGR